MRKIRGKMQTPAPGLAPAAVLAAILSAVLAACLGGCGGDRTGHEDTADLGARMIRVVATTGMINDLVLNVGAGRVRAEALMGPGIDPHQYKASEGDVRRLTEADVIFYNGLHLEAKMGEVLQKMNRTTRTVPVAEAIPAPQRLRPPEFEGAYDPHVWFDVSLWMLAAGRVRDTLAELDPAHAETYRLNAGRYLEELAALHREVAGMLAAIPADRRVLITAHDAFNYFGRAYGLEVRGLQGISTVTEAGTGDVQELAAFIADRRIPAVFIESSVPPRAIQAVQAAVRARGFEVAIGGELFSDAMGDPGTPAGAYQGMVRHNARTVAAGLSR